MDLRSFYRRAVRRSIDNSDLQAGERRGVDAADTTANLTYALAGEPQCKCLVVLAIYDEETADARGMRADLGKVGQAFGARAVWNVRLEDTDLKFKLDLIDERADAEAPMMTSERAHDLVTRLRACFGATTDVYFFTGVKYVALSTAALATHYCGFIPGILHKQCNKFGRLSMEEKI